MSKSMSKTRVDHEHISDVINDKLAEAYDILCKEYGIEVIEWYYPFEDDAGNAFDDLCKATAEAIEQTISWYED